MNSIAILALVACLVIGIVAYQAYMPQNPPSSSDFDFAISVSPLTQTYNKPYQIAMTYTVVVSVIKGTPEPIVLDWFGLMTGASAEYNEGTFTPPFTKTAIIYPSDLTPVGTYTLTVTCSSGSLVHSVSVTLIVTR